MKPSKLTILSFCALGAVVLSGTGWWFASASVSSMATNYVRMIKTTQQGAAKSADDARIAELVRKTADTRTQLETILNVDVLSAANIIESVGERAFVDIQVTGASTGGPGGKGTTVPTVRTVLFMFTAQGTFDHIVHAMDMLAALPIPATLDQLDLTTDASSLDQKVAREWRMTGRIKLFTNATSTL